MRQVAVLVALLGAILLGPPADAQTSEPSGQDGVSIALLDAPVDRADDPRARWAIVDHLRPGAVIERRVRVWNHADEPAEVSLYPAASAVVDGRWAPPDGRPANDLSGWTAVSPSTVTLAAGSHRDVVVRVEIPQTATNGERYGVIWAEPPATTVDGVRMVHRAGVRMYVSVGEGAEPVTDFRIGELQGGTGEDGVRRVWAVVENTGGRAIDARAELVLADPAKALRAGPYEPSGTATVLPGAAVPVVFDLPSDLADGPWDATLTVRSGTLERTRTGRVDLATALEPLPAPAEPAADVAAPSPRPQERTGGSNAPLAVVGVALVLIAGSAAAGVRLRSATQLSTG